MTFRAKAKSIADVRFGGRRRFLGRALSCLSRRNEVRRRSGDPVAMAEARLGSGQELITF
jgi:hypothetical protein